jgi:proteasome lid subunit RPN8/RPN11
MDEEYGFGRAKPTIPYQLNGARLLLPRQALNETLSLLRAAGNRESCVFWYGPRGENGNGEVALVIAPKQISRRLNYTVPTPSVSEMARHVPAGWKPVAQVHSHPGMNVEHSTYDDEMAISKRALSLVFPFYGHWNNEYPRGIGFHEFQNGFWHQLALDQTRLRSTLVDGQVTVKDLR